MIGTRIAHYEVTAKLGEGGMGEVYRATDTKLNREVALKILPDQFASDSQRMGRFQREAEVLASLDHPNIGAIYGIEEAGETKALVLQLIEGPTLADRIAEGPIPVDEALPTALQIAEALEAAHEKGIIHRDLKPANIKLTPEGQVKVLDFGLAKAMENEPTSSADRTQSPTLSMAATQAGLILGTAAYMSPEQARGQPVDKRTDIWSFGVVLFEMLAGDGVFEGEDLSTTLACVIKDEPDWDRLSRRVPLRVRQLLGRCLEKEAKQRLRDIGEARIALDLMIRHPAAVPEASASRTGFPWIMAVVLAVALVAAIWTLWQARDGGPTGGRLARFMIETPWYLAPNWTDFEARISPDGSNLVYNCREGNDVDICLRPLNSLSHQALGQDARDLRELFFSPDGEWLGLLDRDGLKRISLRGGPAQTISTLAMSQGWGEIRGAAWAPDGSILVGSSSGLLHVGHNGGEPRQVVATEQEGDISGYFDPHFLPDGTRALITVAHRDVPPAIGIVNLDDSSVRQLGLSGEASIYAPTGHIVFRQQRTLFAAPFDVDSDIVGDPVPVLEGIRSGPHLATDGTLIYIPTREASSARLLWVDRTGRSTPIAGERRNYSHLDLSPDGTKAILEIEATYLLDIVRGTRNLSGGGGFPIWHSDGRRIIAQEDRNLVLRFADGQGLPEVLVETDGRPAVATSWNSVTGDLAYYDHLDFDIWIRPQSGEPFAFLAGPARMRSGRFSPDGELLAYVSDETGEYQVYVTPYPGPGPRVAASIDGGLSPIWSARGDELFFRRGGKVMAVPVSRENGLELGVPGELFDGPYTLDLMGHQRYDVAPDGQSFLMVENSDDFSIVVIQNWLAELEALTTGGR